MHLKSALYICYFGLREPLVQTQVLPYLRYLANEGWKIHLLTFESGWPESYPDSDPARAELEASGIIWSARSYSTSHSVFAKLWDIAGGVVSARRIARKNQVRIIHGRAHVGTAIACLAAFLTRRKVLFDIRGFNPEEYVDSGHWPAGGLKFRLLKFSERVMVRCVSGFVILTQIGRKYFFADATHPSTDDESLYHLPDGRPVQVIPCCVDLQRFHFNAKDALIKDQLKSEIQLGHTERIMAHVGALGGLYPVDRILSVFAELYRDNPKTGFLILCQNNTSLIRNQYSERGLPLANLWIGKVRPEEVPRYLSMADWGLSLKRSGYSQFSCSPTKIPEYLLAGLPVLASQGIGDTDHLLTKNRVGVIFNAFDDDSIRTAIEQMNALSEDCGLQARCMETAVREFDLNTIGGPRYAEIYAEMIRE